MRRAEKKPRNEAGPGRISKFGPVSPASRPNRGGSPQLGCGPDHSTADNSKKRDRHHSIASYSSIPCAQIEARFPCANTAALQLPLPYWRWPRFSGSHPGPLKPTGPDRSAQAQAQPSSLCHRSGDMTPAQKTVFILIDAMLAVSGVTVGLYSVHGSGWAWASIILGVCALASGLYLLMYLLILLRRSKA